MTKDYIVRLKDSEKNIYVIDEQNGIELIDYLLKINYTATLKRKAYF